MSPPDEGDSTLAIICLLPVLVLKIESSKYKLLGYHDSAFDKLPKPVGSIEYLSQLNAKAEPLLMTNRTEKIDILANILSLLRLQIISTANI
jgi:hypothetical protein